MALYITPLTISPHLPCPILPYPNHFCLLLLLYQLACFHVLLWRKGQTTYDFIVEQQKKARGEEASSDGDDNNNDDDEDGCQGKAPSRDSRDSLGMLVMAGGEL